MESVTKFLKFAFAILMTVVLISTAVWLFQKGMNVARGYGEKESQVSYNIANKNKTRYDGMIVNGADVLNAINELKSDGVALKVTVKMKSGESVTDKTASEFTEFVNLPGGEFYINPYANFLGSVERNANGVISGVTFVQQEYVASAEPKEDFEHSGGDDGSGVTNAELKSEIEQFTNVANNLTTAVSGLQLAIADLKTGGSGGSDGVNRADIAVIKDSISSLATTVNGIQQFCDEFDGNHSVDLSSVSAQLLQIQTKLDEIGAGSSSGTSTDDVQQAISSNETVQQLLVVVTELSNALDTLAERVAGIEVSVSGAENADGTVTPGLTDEVGDLQAQVIELSNQLDDMQDVLEYLVTAVGG